MYINNLGHMTKMAAMSIYSPTSCNFILLIVPSQHFYGLLIVLCFGVEILCCLHLMYVFIF